MRAKKYWISIGIVLIGLVALLRWNDRPSLSAPLATTGESAPAGSASSEVPAAAAQTFAGAALAALPAADNAPDAGALFNYIAPPAQAATWEARIAAPTRELHYVKINREVAEGKTSPFWKMGGGGQLDLTLPNGQVIPVVIEETKQQGAQAFVSKGRIEGDAYGRAHFAYQDGQMSAVVEDLAHGTWELRAMADSVAQWYQVDPAKIAPCGSDHETHDPQKLALIARQAEAAQRVRGQTAGAQIGANDTIVPPDPTIAADIIRPEIRILMVHTDALAITVSPTAIATRFNLSIAILNDDLANSQVAVTVVLAGIMSVPYAEDESTTEVAKYQSESLERVASVSDGIMDAVHSMRDQVSADLVCLALRRGDPDSAGIAYLVTRQGNVYNATQAFSVVEYGVMSVQSIFSHEIGHNLGCAHDRENAKTTAGANSDVVFPYSYGYRFNGADGVEYRTIMSYAPGQRLRYFSNPDITAPAPISRPVGIPAGQSGEADNARTIRQLALEVASYRMGTQSPANLGRLINVSTRALAGTGARQLIGGFIVSGSQPKSFLVRAIGPGLTQFGITDALADPTMSLVRQSDGATITQNDNWGTLPGSTATTMASVGAFALVAGSRDAVIIASLPAGGYTATIQGVNGTTGTALVEAYELDANGGRLSNISTRGYADLEHPMIGGFIVQADPANPGKTKRVMIRAIGPSLATFGVEGAMNDPILALHDAAGTLILQNDDWSSGNNGSDAQPAVRIYSEQQIAAAGPPPPGNRRDSAVMVDLLPGAYTAIVRPLEILPDQLQKPGVALIEVFEINP